MFYNSSDEDEVDAETDVRAEPSADAALNSSAVEAAATANVDPDSASGVDPIEVTDEPVAGCSSAAGWLRHVFTARSYFMFSDCF